MLSGPRQWVEVLTLFVMLSVLIASESRDADGSDGCDAVAEMLSDTR